ncbi:ankyrin repeat domain-containing protein [Pochonia chlamydosporia 170]|uniref:Ankyrin repeat domain-containing protein n=1 Tax=Pochonia chlamydosporia 170 TaxID=1380566 RepID=A0A179F0X0_METCM|nr:ankyrin repeat domain-containing protein [Pochonia chlamydosporia 170]OAQ59115.2 ankyrin repeat domain-containing protein [Pochonia chlamydosporia 170]
MSSNSQKNVKLCGYQNQPAPTTSQVCKPWQVIPNQSFTLQLGKKMYRLLLDRGADVNLQDCDGRTALHLATERGLEAMVRLLLERGTDTKADYNAGQSPLSDASMDIGNGALDLAPLSLPIDVNCKDFMGRTALHVAVEGGFESLVHLLLDHGANISA